jgi:hypothetical protein
MRPTTTMTQKMIFILSLLLFIIQTTNSFTLHLESTEERCVADGLKKDALATGFYSVERDPTDDKPTRVHLSVTGPDGSIVFSSENAMEGKFAFAAALDGKYETCIRNTDLISHRVVLKLKSGVEALDLTEVAQKEHLRPLALELLRLEKISSEIRSEILAFSQAEADMRNINESTNTRVKYLTVFSCTVCFLVGIGQVYFVRTFLRRKKVI